MPGVFLCPDFPVGMIILSDRRCEFLDGSAVYIHSGNNTGAIPDTNRNICALKILVEDGLGIKRYILGKKIAVKR